MKSLLKKLSPLLNDLVPEDIALKGIEKLSPKIGQFLKRGLASGLPLAGGLSFLRSAMSGRGNQEINPALRPDERASEKQIQSSKKQSDLLKGALKFGLGTAGGFGATKIAGNLASTLIGNEKEPEQRAQSPEQEEMARQEALGEFNQRKQKPNMRQGLEEDLERQYGTRQAKANLIEAYAPELHQIISEQVQAGTDPQMIADQLRTMKDYSKIISKLEQDYKAPFSRIIASLYGAQPRQEQQQTQQSGPGQQALIQAIQAYKNIRGR
jgi:hypothetical protein